MADSTRKNLLENEVVLIVPNDSDKNISSFENVTAENIIAVMTQDKISETNTKH